MFELLLQADRALSGGNLDQAERTYWQLSELDPSNAIAIAGLARVALTRGDLRLARIFATRALAMDPENVVAARIIEMIDASGGDVRQLEPLPEDLPLIPVEQLEALSRRRVNPEEDHEEAPPQPPAETAEGTAQTEPQPEAIPEPPCETTEDQGELVCEPAASAEEFAAARPDPSTRRRTSIRPEFRLGPLPERGRRRFEPLEMKATPLADDPFAAAESEAVIEAVDAIGEEDFQQPANESAHGPSAQAAEPVAEAAPAGDLHELPDEAEAGGRGTTRLARPGDGTMTEDAEASAGSDEPDALSALRAALLAGEADAEPTSAAGLPQDVVSAGTDAPASDLDKAASDEDDLIARRIAMLAGDAEVAGDAEPEVGAVVEVTPEVQPIVAAEVAVAPAPTVEGAPAVESTAVPEVQPESSTSGAASADPAWELSEHEAESQALREAMAQVLDGDSAGTHPEATPVGWGESSPVAEPQAGATAAESAEPVDAEPVGAKTGELANEEASPQHNRRGFLRRIIGG